MKLAIVGSRKFPCPNFVKDKVYDLCSAFSLDSAEQHLTIVSGGCYGVDTWAEEVAKEWKWCVDTIIFKPDWEKHGKKAGFMRNIQIVDEATHLWAFWDGESKGTKHSIDLALKKGIPVDIYIRK